EQQLTVARQVAAAADEVGFPLLLTLRPGEVVVSSGKDRWDQDAHGLDLEFTDLAARCRPPLAPSVPLPTWTGRGSCNWCSTPPTSTRCAGSGRAPSATSPIAATGSPTWSTRGPSGRNWCSRSWTRP